MKKVLLLIVLFLPFPAYAQQAPFGRPDIPISSRDRVYAADQNGPSSSSGAVPGGSISGP